VHGPDAVPRSGCPLVPSGSAQPMLHAADGWQRLRSLGIVIALVGVGASSPVAQTITDGDTLKQGGVTYRFGASTRPRLSRFALMAGRPAA
jgi:hypothetical protein